MAKKSVFVFDTNIDVILNGVSQLCMTDDFMRDRLVFKRWCESVNICADVEDIDKNDLVHVVDHLNPRMVFNYNTPLAMMERPKPNVFTYLNQNANVKTIFVFLDTFMVSKESKEWKQFIRLLNNMEKLNSEKITLIVRKPPHANDTTASAELRRVSNEAWHLIMKHIANKRHMVKYVVDSLASMRHDIVIQFLLKLIKVYVKFKKFLTENGLLNCFKTNFETQICNTQVLKQKNATVTFNLKNMQNILISTKKLYVK